MYWIVEFNANLISSAEQLKKRKKLRKFSNYASVVKGESDEEEDDDDNDSGGGASSLEESGKENNADNQSWEQNI